MRVEQLRAARLDSSAVSKRMARGVLHRVHRGVYAWGHRALSREGHWLAAVFAAGEGAALSHLSAAELWEVRRRRAPLIDVVVPGQRRLKHPIRVHRTRRLDPRDVTVHRGIPVTTIARTLVDLSDILTAPELANVIHEAAYRKRFSVQATYSAIARANGRHRLDVLEAAIEAHLDGSAGARSGFEVTFLALLREAGLPAPLVNTHVHGIEVDLYWPDRRLCVEADGPGHTRPRTRREDAARDRTLRAAGYTVLRFTDDDVERRPAWVLSHLAI